MFIRLLNQKTQEAKCDSSHEGYLMNWIQSIRITMFHLQRTRRLPSCFALPSLRGFCAPHWYHVVTESEIKSLVLQRISAFRLNISQVWSVMSAASDSHNIGAENLGSAHLEFELGVEPDWCLLITTSEEIDYCQPSNLARSNYCHGHISN